MALHLRGPAGRTVQVDAVVDTGFNRFLTLPSAMVAELELPLTGFARVVLADGTEVSFKVYGAMVLWGGRERDVAVYSVDGTPLIGMVMLSDHSLYAEVRDGGRIAIQAID